MQRAPAPPLAVQPVPAQHRLHSHRLHSHRLHSAYPACSPTACSPTACTPTACTPTACAAGAGSPPSPPDPTDDDPAWNRLQTIMRLHQEQNEQNSRSLAAKGGPTLPRCQRVRKRVSAPPSDTVQAQASKGTIPGAPAASSAKPPQAGTPVGKPAERSSIAAGRPRAQVTYPQAVQRTPRPPEAPAGQASVLPAAQPPPTPAFPSAPPSSAPPSSAPSASAPSSAPPASAPPASAPPASAPPASTGNIQAQRGHVAAETPAAAQQIFAPTPTADATGAAADVTADVAADVAALPADSPA